MSIYKRMTPRIISVLALGLILALLVSMISVGTNEEEYAAYAETVDYYQLKVGDENVALFVDEQSAYDTIKSLKDKYVSENDGEVDVKMTPAITVETVSLPKAGEQPVVDTSIPAVVETLVEKKGEVEGEEAELPATEQLVNVTVEYETTVEEEIAYETIYEEDPEMYSDEEEYVSQEGVNGTTKITKKVVEVNGVVNKEEVVSEEVVTEATPEVIVYGTLEREEYVEEEEYSEEDEEYTEEESEEEYTDEEEYSEDEEYDEESDVEEEGPISENDNQQATFDDSMLDETQEVNTSTYSGDRQQIVDYAMQFIGNPYVWGGISLTNGCDCSGFIYSVFNDCGYNISRWPDDDFPHVSASELLPGDICTYNGHYAIYIGDGMEISAVNEEQGIRTHPMYYSRGAFEYGIRIIGD